MPAIGTCFAGYLSLFPFSAFQNNCLFEACESHECLYLSPRPLCIITGSWLPNFVNRFVLFLSTGFP